MDELSYKFLFGVVAIWIGLTGFFFGARVRKDWINNYERPFFKKFGLDYPPKIPESGDRAVIMKFVFKISSIATFIYGVVMVFKVLSQRPHLHYYPIDNSFDNLLYGVFAIGFGFQGLLFGAITIKEIIKGINKVLPKKPGLEYPQLSESGGKIIIVNRIVKLISIVLLIGGALLVYKGLIQMHY